MSHTFKSGTVSATTWTDTLGGTITVEQDAYQLSTTTNSINLSDGPWTVTINGTVSGRGSSALLLDAFDAAKNSKVTIGTEGTVSDTAAGSAGIIVYQTTDISNSGVVHGGAIGIFNGSAAAADKFAITNTKSGTILGSDCGISSISQATMTLTNAGRIVNETASPAVSAVGATIITNTGVIDGGITTSGGYVNKLTNHGTILGTVDGADQVTNTGYMSTSLIFGSSPDKLVNSGQIGGALTFGAGNDVVTNSGTINGNIAMAGGDDKVTNTGTIHGSIDCDTGKNTLINSGTIDQGLTDVETLTNTGTIHGLIAFANSDVTITNSGTIDLSIFYNAGNNTITNSGTTGAITLGIGNDKVTDTGVTHGDIRLGAGDDTFVGGNHNESVFDDDGKDSYKLGGGNDSFTTDLKSTDGVDTIDGGSGTDTYDASGSTGVSLAINLDTKAHFFEALLEPAHTAFTDAGASEQVTGFEIVYGVDDAAGGDIIIGGSAGEQLHGLGGSDGLWGGGGNDLLGGGDGADFLTGGLGVDLLYGGAGDDTFAFETTKDSGTTRATRDTIEDFEGNALSVHDIIDVSLIDADSKSAGDQPFNFIGMNVAFNHVAGELHAMVQDQQTIVEGDTNGDAKPDFQIAIQGLVTLAAVNFEL